MPHVPGSGRGGLYRKRLLLQRQQATPVVDGDGNDVTPWQDVQHVWAEVAVASVQSSSGARGEREEAGQMEQLRPWEVLVRGNLRRVIDHNCRFVLDGNRVLDIRGVTDLGEMHQQLRIQAIEKVY